jgi:hypothetical protein
MTEPTTRGPAPRRLLIVLAFIAAMAVLAAACGSDSTDTVTDATDAAVGPTATDAPAATPDDEETPGDQAPSLGVLVDGGLTVEEALAADPGIGVIAVKGFFYQDDTGTYLCSALAESLPPLCGGTWVPLEGVDPGSLGAPVQDAQGISWTDATVSVLGRIDAGTLTVDPTVAG